jgi:imidazolonepropionase-like amidohydrolase
MRPRPAVRHLARGVLLAAVVGAAAARAARPPAQVTAIRAGRLVDPDAGTAARDQVILVERGRITRVGADVPIPAGATVVDLSRATVLPGLVDAHTHLCLDVQAARDAGRYYYTTLNDPDAMRAVQGVANARAMLEAGFTAVRDVGNEGRYACVQVRRAVQQGLVPGPTMLTAGRIIAPYGGQFQLQPDRPGLAEPEYAFADTRDEMVKAVRENAHFGARLIKVVVDDQRYIYSADDLRFLKAEAARAGLKLAAHAWTRAGAHHAAEAGVASIEHGPDMADSTLALARRNGVVLVGTEFLALADTGAARRRWIDRLRRAHRAGVTLVYGTDAIDRVPGRTRGAVALDGIDPWVEAGVPAPAIVRAMTTDAARLLGIDGDRGPIRPGLAADLIATEGDPLADARALKRVVFVMKDGRAVRTPTAPADSAAGGRAAPGGR